MKYPTIVRDTIDFISDTEVCNIGYAEGKLRDSRPYRLEVWSSYGITNATIFISLIDLEEKSEDDIKRILIDNNIIEVIKDDIYITEVEDTKDNSFLSINVPLEGSDVTINKLLVKIKDFEF
ncbi:MAG: hypothetical protein J1F35_07225 [Erysipelotrichales bacterium]|nr:hypothetical protein [Erysipelotrichales bacterium]